MSLFDTTQVSLDQALQGATLRQQALSSNLANANVPGYQRRDVDFQGTLRAAVAAGDPAAARFSTSVQPGSVQPDGNGVDADRESAYLAENALLYQGLVTVARGRIDIMLSAMGAS